MNSQLSQALKQIEGTVAAALAKGHAVTAELRGDADIVSLGALFGALEYLKTALKSQHGGRIPQTGTLKIVDHWGRLTALQALKSEIDAKAESDGEAARARVETLWRGIAEAALNLARDIAPVGGMARCAELTDWVVATARAQSEGVAGSIKRMVARV